MKISTYVVNMEKDVSKKERMIEMLLNFPLLDVVFVKAVEGKKLSNEELKKCADIDEFKKRYSYQATLPALGCSLSHLEIYKKLCESTQPSLILEDDATLVKNFTEKIKPIYNWLSEQNTPVVVLLSPCFSYNRYKVPMFTTGNSIVVNVKHGQMTSGYLINPAAARLLACKLQPVRYLADDWDVMKGWGLNLMGVVPNLTDCPTELGEIGLSQVNSDMVADNWFQKLNSILSFRIRYILGMRYSRRTW